MRYLSSLLSASHYKDSGGHTLKTKAKQNLGGPVTIPSHVPLIQSGARAQAQRDWAWPKLFTGFCSGSLTTGQRSVRLIDLSSKHTKKMKKQPVAGVWNLVYENKVPAFFLFNFQTTCSKTQYLTVSMFKSSIFGEFKNSSWSFR